MPAPEGGNSRAVARWKRIGKRLCIVAPVEPSWKCMSSNTCSPKSCMKPSAPRASARRMRACHHFTAAGLVKSMTAPSALKFDVNV